MKLLIAWVTVLVVAAHCPAIDYPIYVNTNYDASDRYCGLYCVYQAGRMTNHPVSLDTLVQPKRLRGVYGTSVADLAATCEEFRIPYRYVAAASYADMLLLDRPAIALIKSAPESHAANHWVLLLEADWESARVYDPSCGVLRVSAAELQSVWGGPVLLIEAGADSGDWFLWHVTKTLLTLFTVGVVLAVLRLGSGTRRKPLGVLLGAALLLAAVAQLADPASFLHNGAVVRQTAAVAAPRTVERLTPEELLASRGEYTVIDVRTPRQFRAHSAHGGVNVPFQSSYWKNRRLLEAYADDHPVVLYCNTAECGWAESMAKSSLFHRFTRVYVLEDGLRGYIRAKGTLGGAE